MQTAHTQSYFDRKLLQNLIAGNYITEEQMAIVLQELQEADRCAYDVLRMLKFMNNEELYNITTQVMLLDRYQAQPIDRRVIERFSLMDMLRYECLPFFENGHELHFLFYNLEEKSMQRANEFFYGRKNDIRAYFCSHETFAHIISQYIDRNAAWYHIKRLMSAYNDQRLSAEEIAPLLLELILSDIILNNRNDVYFSVTQPSVVTVQGRQDHKSLCTLGLMHHTHWQRLCHLIKVLARLNPNVHDLPQSGQFSRTALGHSLTIRASTHPTSHGERMSLRVFRGGAYHIHSLDALNIDPSVVQQLQKDVSKTQGLLLVVGPTGSGKTTTLYSIIHYLAHHQKRNVMTLEDPIEQHIPLVNQSEISHHMGYADGIRSCLRQHPDVILVGEIRDAETAQMAYAAAMTGHLVLSTIHSGSSFHALLRLIDLGVDAATVSEHTIGAVSQRLLPVRCDFCVLQGKNSSSKSLASFCQRCRVKTYQPIHEYLHIPSEMKSILAHHEPCDWPKYLPSYRSLYEHGLHYVRKNIVTQEALDEVCHSL